MEIIQRIEHEIERLNKQILDDESFRGRESVNLHGLVCLLRFAAWRYPQELRNWFTRDPKKYKITINPGIVKRFSLSKPKGHDGAQLRIHIFDHAEETAKHNHQRSFITMCIQGSYEYRYYDINYDNPKEKIKFYYRPEKEDREIDENGVSQPFKFVKEEMGEIFRIQYDGWGSKKRSVSVEDQEIFDQEYGPMFVDNQWYHTVHSHGSVDEPVITVLIRRQKEKPEDTLFIRTESDKKFEEEADTEDATPQQIDTMWEQVSSALTKGSTPADIRSSISSNAINEFMNPVSKIIRISEQFLGDEENFSQLQNFLKLNDFSFCPIIKQDNGREILVKCIDDNGNEFFTKKEDSLGPDTPIMFGILYTVLSPKFVVPIVDQSNGQFLGLLSLFDILRNLKRFASSIITASLDSDASDVVTQCANLITAVNNLHEFAKENRYELRKAKPEAINDILMPLGDLLLNIDLTNLMISEYDSPEEKGTWIESVSQSMFEVDENCRSTSLLQELKQVGDFDSFAYRMPDGSYKLVEHTGNETNLDAITEHATPEQVVSKINAGNWPLFAEIESSDELKIISTEELFSQIGMRTMSTTYAKASKKETQSMLNNLILKGVRKHPDYTEDDFESVPMIFTDLKG